MATHWTSLGPLYFFILCIKYFSDGHDCGHIVPARHEVLHNVHLGEPAHVVKKRSISQRLRIHLHYDKRSISRLPKDRRKLVKENIIPESVRYWEDTLRVRHTVGPIKLLPQCVSDRVRYKDGDPHPYCVDGCAETTSCGETVVPPDHLDACREAPIGEKHHVTGYGGAGVRSADFILYVSAHATQRCDIGTTVAYAAYCQLEGALDRPVAGYVNLCPESISTAAHDIHQMHSTIKHEILHALGFSAGLYAFFRDDNGEPLTKRLNSTGKPAYNETLQLYQWSDRVIRRFSRPDWKVKGGTVRKDVQMVVTPRVVEETRRHFNCSTLEGAELEDQGVVGTALTHWEKRVFENEVMTGTYTQNPMVSRITLALMEDTGWYRVNYDKAEPLRWGRHLGCDFVTRSCHEWMSSNLDGGQHVHPFCNRIKSVGLQTECTDERDAVALCNLVEYPASLPPEYQHFHRLPGVGAADVERYAGSVVLADYCPYIQEFNWKKGDVVVRGSRCGLHENNADPEINYTLERYGNRSACFEHSAPWRLRRCSVDHTVEHWGSGCYKFTCSAVDGLHVEVDGTRLHCARAGLVLPVHLVSDGWLHQGSLVCPACEEICASQGVTCPGEESLGSAESLELQAAQAHDGIHVPCSSPRHYVASSALSLLLTLTAVALHRSMSAL